MASPQSRYPDTRSGSAQLRQFPSDTAHAKANRQEHRQTKKKMPEKAKVTRDAHAVGKILLLLDTLSRPALERLAEAIRRRLEPKKP